MSWTIHNSLENAKKVQFLQIRKSGDFRRAKVAKIDTVAVIFEGQKESAVRIQYKAKEQAGFRKKERLLIVYYIATKLRNDFICCMLSYYEDDTDDGKLPPPLNSVMMN